MQNTKTIKQSGRPRDLRCNNLEYPGKRTLYRQNANLHKEVLKGRKMLEVAFRMATLLELDQVCTTKENTRVQAVISKKLESDFPLSETALSLKHSKTARTIQFLAKIIQWRASVQVQSS